MSESQPPSPPPSWRWPIAWGALLTVFLHLPVVSQHLFWVVVFGTFGLTGLPLGVLPVWLATRRERLSSMSGFALGFIAIGVGMITLVLLTLLRGFTIEPEHEALWREAFVEQKLAPEDIDAFFASLQGGRGGMICVLAATVVAFGAGFSGAITALLRGRRRR
ncbi:MAG: hypothetical protein H6838_12035 [Planctomycetes bacterium]|nr:hypothetical protein [Planctomycetota bacterium]MCB9886217.1 hypothetical protein [Planctomycetota bacterium]